MSRAEVLTCDGCGKLDTRPARQSPYPAGWLRLSATGRPSGEATSTNLGTVDICTPECAPEALAAVQAVVGGSGA